MTAKKKTLIELMLDAGVTPSSIDERMEYFVSDEPCREGESWISGYDRIPVFMPKTKEFSCSGYVDCLAKTPYHPAKQGSQIVTKQQFIDAYNERNSLKEKVAIVNNTDGEIKAKTNIPSDMEVNDIEPCKHVDSSAYNSLSFEDAEKLANNYASLSNVLRRAYDQAASGKGHERHAQELPFNKQPMQQIQDLVGEGFALGQAIKKMQESQRLPQDAAIRELLGAINYIAGVIIHKEKQGRK